MQYARVLCDLHLGTQHNRKRLDEECEDDSQLFSFKFYNYKIYFLNFIFMGFWGFGVLGLGLIKLQGLYRVIGL